MPYRCNHGKRARAVVLDSLCCDIAMSFVFTVEHFFSLRIDVIGVVLLSRYQKLRFPTEIYPTNGTRRLVDILPNPFVPNPVNLGKQFPSLLPKKHGERYHS